MPWKKFPGQDEFIWWYLLIVSALNYNITEKRISGFSWNFQDLSDMAQVQSENVGDVSGYHLHIQDFYLVYTSGFSWNIQFWSDMTQDTIGNLFCGVVGGGVGSGQIV